MGSKRAKGNRFQNWIEGLLKDWGYAVHNQKSMGRLIHTRDKKTGERKTVYISTRNDIFGTDLVAIKPGEPVRFIQATMDTNLGRKLNQIADYPWPEDHCIVEVWQKKDRGALIWRLDFEKRELRRWAEVQRRRLLVYA